MITTVILTGRPGSGKGTQGKLLAESRGWMHFSTGEQFKMLREQESLLGRRVREVYDAGNLLPDWFATYLFENAILNIGQEAGIVCEGYPRSLSQAHTFDTIVSWLDRAYIVIDLAVSDDEVTERMLKRSLVEHRPDSVTPEQVQARLRTYHEHTEPVLTFFKEQGTLRSVDGTGTPEHVAAAIRAELS
ncbi:MAG: adenylate kinase [Parcubacteria group bacterium]|nr:adenylate kinase [Parcubacteria group bacterium]